MHTEISRRSMLATTGSAAVATLSLGGLAVAAGLPTGGNTSADEIIAKWNALDPETRAIFRALALQIDGESDAELRQLWAEYQEQDDANTAAWEADHAFRDDLERSLFDGKTIEEIAADGLLTEAERARWLSAWRACHPHTLWETASGHADRLNKTVKAIRATPAEGLFGIAVKLAAMPDGWQGEDVEDSALAALGEMNRMLGLQFSIDGKSRFVERDEDEEEANG